MTDAQRIVAFVNPSWHFEGMPGRNYELGRGVRLAYLADVLPKDVTSQINPSELSRAARSTFALVLDWSRNTPATAHEDAFLSRPNGESWQGHRILERTNEAVWLSKPSAFAFHFIVEFSIEAPPRSYMCWGRERSLVYRHDCSLEMLSCSDLDQARALNEAMGKVPPGTSVSTATASEILSTRPGPLRIAA